ncbi:hypothetical protein PR048_031646 [Dryococelus australis]|uniref:Uncharacterized protein n=1 Tax=Dryococelus australis TaxID=614101 RepID=A0ABQ9G9W7_9NEOP|nr:hypothetical protein PR048_031646 [Dryococelus australis]
MLERDVHTMDPADRSPCIVGGCAAVMDQYTSNHIRCLVEFMPCCIIAVNRAKGVATLLGRIYALKHAAWQLHDKLTPPPPSKLPSTSCKVPLLTFLLYEKRHFLALLGLSNRDNSSQRHESSAIATILRPSDIYVALQKMMWSEVRHMPLQYRQAKEAHATLVEHFPEGTVASERYLYIRASKMSAVIPSVVNRTPTIHWRHPWKILSDPNLSSDLRAAALGFYSNIVATQQHKYGIHPTADPTRPLCGNTDTVLRRNSKESLGILEYKYLLRQEDFHRVQFSIQLHRTSVLQRRLSTDKLFRSEFKIARPNFLSTDDAEVDGSALIGCWYNPRALSAARSDQTTLGVRRCTYLRAYQVAYNEGELNWCAMQSAFARRTPQTRAKLTPLDIHGDLSPFLLQPFHELSNGFWKRLTSPHPAIQFVLKMFYRVEVGAPGGPVQSANIVVDVPLHSSP